MKNLFNLYGLFLLTILFSCSGSETYQGEWKAMDNDGNKIQIVFEPKQITLDNKSYKYSQNQVSINNGIKTYGIKIGDGRSYLIRFPIRKDDSKAIMMDENESVLYVISRDQYISQHDLYKLN